MIGELYYGARKSGKSKENTAHIDEFVTYNRVLSCNSETARRYGEVKDELRKKGRPIPENDIWIAALAFQYSLTLVTRDNHFGEVSGLIIEEWW